LALAGQGKDEEAGPLLVRGYAGLGLKKSAIPVAFHSRLPDLMRSVALELARLREAAGKPEEAKKWRAEAAKHRSVAPLPREKRS